MVFFVYGNGSDLQITKRLVDEGNKVYYWTNIPFRANWDDLFKEWGVNYIKTPEFPDIPSDVDIIVYTFIGAGSIIDKLKTKYPVFGADSKVQALELNRHQGKEVVRRLGIKTPQEFSASLDEAIERVKKLKKRMVVKPHRNLPTYTTVIPYSWEDTVDILQRIKSRFPHATVSCEEYIEGVEVGLETFFDGEDFLHPINIGFEHKQVNEMNQGPLSGEAGTLMFYEDTPLFYETLYKAQRLLQRLNYHGDICLSFMINKEDGIPYMLEWTCRMGYPEILIQLNALKIDLGELIYNVVFPQPNKTIPIEDIFLTGVCLMAGGSPFERAFKEFGKDFIIHGLDEIEGGVPVIERVMFSHISYEDGKYKTGEYDDRPLVVVGKGFTAAESIIDAYRFARHIKAINAHFRTDIGLKYVKYDCEFLYRLGYISSEKYQRSYAPFLNIPEMSGFIEARYGSTVTT